MHELGIAQSIVGLVKKQATHNGWESVSRVRVEAGALTGVVPSSLELCFELEAKGTPVEGALLEIQTKQATMLCSECDNSFAIESQQLVPCPICGSTNHELISGDQIRVVELDVEDESEKEDPC